MRKVCYTAILGNYDTLKEPVIITPGWEYVCFTDQDIKSKHWTIERVEPGDVRAARKIKVLPPFDADVSIWVDGSIEIRGSADNFIAYAGDADGVLLKHPHRDNVFQEAMAVTRLKKDSDAIVNAQMRRYRDENFIQRAYLPATGIIYRVHNDRTKEFQRVWWEEIENGSHRDQLSFNYAAQKSGYKWQILFQSIYDKVNPFFLLHKHL
jgi:hypothetical protein